MALAITQVRALSRLVDAWKQEQDLAAQKMERFSASEWNPMRMPRK